MIQLRMYFNSIFVKFEKNFQKWSTLLVIQLYRLCMTLSSHLLINVWKSLQTAVTGQL